MQDFVSILSAARVPKWVRFANTPLELKITKLTTTELDRCRRQAQKNGKVDLKKLLPLTFKKSIQGIRGLTLELLEEQFGLHLDNIEKEGALIARQDVIESDPIDEFWMSFVCGLGAVVPAFNYWVMDHNGQNILTEESDEDDEQKKT